MDLLEVDLEVVGALEDLSALRARVGHEAALVLVADVAEEGALEVEAAVAALAAELVAVGRLHHREHVVRVGQALQPAPRGGGCRRRGLVPLGGQRGGFGNSARR